jgi:hypothetical protein
MDEWREEVARHGELAERLRLPAYSWYTPLWHAVDALHAGRYDAARELREQARELGTRAGDGNAELFALMLAVAESFLVGDYDALDIAWVEDKIEHSPAGFSYRAGYAWGLACLGRPDDARAQLDHVLAHAAAELPFDANWTSAIAELAETCIELRDATHAATVEALLAPYAGRHLTAGRAVVSYGVADRHLAGLAALLGRDSEAAERYEAALRGNAALGMGPWIDRARAQRAALMPRFAA